MPNPLFGIKIFSLAIKQISKHIAKGVKARVKDSQKFRGVMIRGAQKYSSFFST